MEKINIKEKTEVLLTIDSLEPINGVLLESYELGVIRVCLKDVTSGDLLSSIKAGQAVVLKNDKDVAQKGLWEIQGKIKEVMEPLTIDIAIKEIPSSSERRSFVRVEDFLPVGIRQLGEGELPFEGEHDSSRLRLLPSDVFGITSTDQVFSTDRDSRNLLNAINAKLDFLIKYIMLKEETGFSIPKRQKVCISGSGLKYLSSVPFKVGSYVEATIILPQIPPRTIITFCEVVRVLEVQEKGKRGFDIALTYLNIQEEDVEAIIQYTFKKQMEDIRRKKTDKETDSSTQ